MSWSADPLHAGFSTRAPYRALASNAATHNVALQQADPGSLLNHYKALLALRNAEPALARGSSAGSQVSGAVFSQRRELGGERLLVVVHVGHGTIAGSAITGLPANATLQRRFGDGSATITTDAQGSLLLDLPAQSTHVFKLPS
jgi:glycosidase